MGPAEWGFLFALAFLWSGVFFLTKIALREMRPFTVVVLRLAIGAVVLHIAVLAIGSRMPTSLRIWVAFFGMGALNNLIPFCLIARGPDADRERSSSDPECHHASLHGAAGASTDP